MNTGMDETTTWAWGVFGALLLIFLSLDLLIHRGGRRRSRQSAYLWSVIWIAIGLAFNIFVWFYLGAEAAKEYLAAYLIEKSLSVDNLFVFLVIFKSLNIPEKHQHDVLLWGILGAIIFRGLFVFVGAAALARYEWVAQVFGVLLIVAAYYSFREDPAKTKENKVVTWLCRHLPVTQKIHDQKFLAKENGRYVATPLLIAVLGLEITDIMFAIDSVPAAFSVSRNIFIVYSSNIFAILGLRALYLALTYLISGLKYLHYGLAGVLAFAGIKLILSAWIHIPALISVAITLALITTAILASLYEPSAIGERINACFKRFAVHYKQTDHKWFRPLLIGALLIAVFGGGLILLLYLNTESSEDKILAGAGNDTASIPKSPLSGKIESPPQRPEKPTKRPEPKKLIPEPPRKRPSIAKPGKLASPGSNTVTTTPSPKGGENKPETISPALKTITVQPGDTLSLIARRIYGNPNKWPLIYQANQRKISNPGLLTVGMELIIPPGNEGKRPRK